MEIKLLRKNKAETYTLGELFIDGVFFGYTCEDRVRNAGETKVYGQTAIPCGIYEVKVTYSPKYKRKMPEIMNVPNFQGIRIHSGNSHLDTEGCVLVGYDADFKKGTISRSREAINALYSLIEQSKTKITIEIV